MIKKSLLIEVGDDPDEEAQLEDYLKGPKWKWVIWNYSERLRSLIKYEDKSQLQEARDLLYDCLEEYDLDL